MVKIPKEVLLQKAPSNLSQEDRLIFEQSFQPKTIHDLKVANS
jgi:hypothetical protein